MVEIRPIIKGILSRGLSLIENSKKSLEKPPVRNLFLAISLGIVLTGVFFCRKPVILVTDKPFIQLYGEKRDKRTKKLLSLELFRRIKTVEIAADAGPDLAAQAAASLSRRPFAVFFPYRYREGANRYLKDRPNSFVFVLGGRNRPESNPDQPWWFCTDSLTDMYRAGLLTGELALQEPENGAAALYHDKLGDGETEAFKQGLADQGWQEEPFISTNAETTLRYLREKAASLVIYKKGDIRFYEDAGRSILFSWTDTAFIPGRTAAVFGDSPWEQIGPALKILKKEKILPGMTGFSLIPSGVTVIKGNFGQKKGNFGINRIKYLKYMDKNTDNNNSV
jgi:hypothetical protein